MFPNVQIGPETLGTFNPLICFIVLSYCGTLTRILTLCIDDCGSGDASDPDNDIVYCDLCKAGHHQKCYGIYPKPVRTPLFPNMDTILKVIETR